MVDHDRWTKAQDAEAEHEAHSPGFTPRSHAVSYFDDYWNTDLESITGERVLSVGGGTGVIHTLRLPRLQVSIDPLYESLSIEVEDSNAMSLCACGEKLPFPNDFFDTVISFNVLDHTREPEAVLEEIFRVLKHRGRFLLAVNTFDIPGFIRDKMGMIDTPHPHHFSTREIRESLRHAGFEIVHFSSRSRFSEGILQLLSRGQFKRVGGRIANIKFTTAVCRRS